MCGIVAMLGRPETDVAGSLLSMLDLLEYRGYDSAGIATLNGTGAFHVTKQVGKLEMLRLALADEPLHGNMGIGHTRWATHGAVTEINAHPHFSNDNTIAVVHNGTIENYRDLRLRLEQLGYDFKSETDTEIIPNLIHYELKRNVPPRPGASRFEEAVVRAMVPLVGAYAFGILSTEYPDELIVVRHSSPLAIGFRGPEFLVASDKLALVGRVKDVVVLDDSHMAVLKRDGSFRIQGINGKTTSEHKKEALTLAPTACDKEGFAHFMFKEILEQPEAIKSACRGRIMPDTGRIKLGAFDEVATCEAFRKAPRITVVACGTSYNSGLVFKEILERIAGVSVNVELASEFIYRSPVLFPGEVVVGISQSGSTRDTLKALEHARDKHGAFLYSVTNVVGSSMADMVGVGTFLHAGPEFGVASTKAFTAQCAVLLMIALRIAELRGDRQPEKCKALALALLQAPETIVKTIHALESVEHIAKRLLGAKRFFFIGRTMGSPLSMEGALKLKEIAYVNAEGYAAGELKHGPLALIEDGVPVIATILDDGLHDKVLSNVSEIVARKGVPIIVSTAHPNILNGLLEDDRKKGLNAYTGVQLPQVPPEIAPLIVSVFMQLFAYYMGTLQGFDVDKPRNLAKSVTVE